MWRPTSLQRGCYIRHCCILHSTNGCCARHCTHWCCTRHYRRVLHTSPEEWTPNTSLQKPDLHTSDSHEIRHCRSRCCNAAGARAESITAEAGAGSAYVTTRLESYTCRTISKSCVRLNQDQERELDTSPHDPNQQRVWHVRQPPPSHLQGACSDSPYNCVRNAPDPRPLTSRACPPHTQFLEALGFKGSQHRLPGNRASLATM